MSNHLDARYWTDELAAAIRADKGVPRVIGLDVEWKPTFAAGGVERRAAVLQVAGPGICLVMQLMKLDGYLPRKLRVMLRNPRLLKVGGCDSGWVGSVFRHTLKLAHTHTHVPSARTQVGVSINSDLSKLRRDWGLVSAGSHDVGLAGGRIVHGEPFRMCSVSSLVEAIWGADIDKCKSVRLRYVV